MNQLYDAGREGFLDGSINWSTGDIRAMLVKSTYTFSAAHKFLADLGSVDNGRTASLASKTVAAGVADAADTTVTAAAAAASSALVLFQHTGSDATARVIAYIDDRVQFTIAAAAATSATSITTDPLAGGIASGAAASKISGNAGSPASITTSGVASGAARALSVVALSAGVSAADVYEVATTDGSGLPFTPALSQVVNITWNNGANRIFKL